MAPFDRPPVYADENVGRSLLDGLRQRGFELVSTDEAGRRATPDDEQLTFATSLGRVLLTHDRLDFVRLHHAWAARGCAHAGIAALPQGGPVARRVVRAALLIDWLAAEGGPTSCLAIWGKLQTELHRGLRLEGYTVEEARLALGLPTRT